MVKHKFEEGDYVEAVAKSKSHYKNVIAGKGYGKIINIDEDEHLADIDWWRNNGDKVPRWDNYASYEDIKIKNLIPLHTQKYKNMIKKQEKEAKEKIIYVIITAMLIFFAGVCYINFTKVMINSIPLCITCYVIIEAVYLKYVFEKKDSWWMFIICNILIALLTVILFEKAVIGIFISISWLVMILNKYWSYIITPLIYTTLILLIKTLIYEIAKRCKK